jgi:hypothetical protein
MRRVRVWPQVRLLGRLLVVVLPWGWCLHLYLHLDGKVVREIVDRADADRQRLVMDRLRQVMAEIREYEDRVLWNGRA